MHQLRRNHAQHLIAAIVSVRIVELLEVVNIHHRDGVIVSELEHGLIKGPSRQHSSKLVTECHVVRHLNQCNHQDQSGSQEIEAWHASRQSRINR